MKDTKALLAKIKEKDLLAPSLFNLVKLVAEHPGKTASELFNYKGCPCSVKGSVSADLSRLASTGVIKKDAIRSCTATRRKAATWVVTGNIPKIEATTPISEVERKIQDLEAKLEKLYQKRETLLNEPAEEIDPTYNVFWLDVPSPHDIHSEIQLCAYYKAEKRGFAPGGELNDWLEAEKEIESFYSTVGKAA